MESLSTLNNPDLSYNAEDEPEPLVNDDLSELRHLLLQPEQERLQELNERLEDPTLHAQDVSKILPEALLLSAKQGDKLSSSLSTTVEEIVRVSIKRNIRTFSEILFPVIGPAIRKAISESLKQMVQSLNQTLERSFSWQGMKWRLESLRSGKSFAEIVMLNSMLYRVEQVFLIHAKTGLLLQHVTADAEASHDADLVSAMLTAIQDFVNDSFNITAGNELNTIQMGDFTIWLVQGPKAVIAGAIRGTAPEDLRLVFNNALEMIHMELADELDEFDGDANLMLPAQYHLEACLQSRMKEKPHKFSPLMIIFLIAVISGLGLLLFWSIQERSHWRDYLQQLEAEPGIIVTQVSKQNGGYRVYGLRDPLAREPGEIFTDHAIEPERVVHLFQPYQALSKELVLLRAQRILTPPKTVTLSYDKAVLKARGAAPFTWISDTRILARALPGVLKFDDSELSTAMDFSSLAAPDSISLTLNDDILAASGSAPYTWLATARNRALQLPGIKHYDDSNVIIEVDLASLSPPDSIKLNFQDGILKATGSAAHVWILAAREQALQIPGVAHYDDSEVIIEPDLSSLNPPDSVSLNVQNGRLSVSGSAPHQWIISAQELAQQIPGIEHYDDSEVIIEADYSGLNPPDSVSLKYQNGSLIASGNAAHAWIVATRSKALLIPGIIDYNDSNLQDNDISQWQSLKSQLEQVVMLFGVDAAASWHENSQSELTRIPAVLKRFLQISKTLNRPARIIIVGHSDSSGRPQRNLELSQRRAEYMHYYLVSQGINPDHLMIRGAGANEPVRDESSEEGKKMNRSVTFKIHLTNNR